MGVDGARSRREVTTGLGSVREVGEDENHARAVVEELAVAASELKGWVEMAGPKRDSELANAVTRVDRALIGWHNTKWRYSAETGHRVALTFEGGLVSGRLIHPESGCDPATSCPECFSDYSEVPPEDRCRDCRDMKVEEGTCWLEGWFDQFSIEELLEGEVTVPVAAECDGETLILNVTTELTQAEPLGEAPEIPVFEGTRAALDGLSVRKGE